MFLGLEDHDIPAQDELRSINLDVAFQLFLEKYAKGRYGPAAIKNTERVQYFWRKFYPDIQTGEITPQVYVAWRKKLVAYQPWRVNPSRKKVRPRQPFTRNTINQYAETSRRAFRWMALQRFIPWEQFYLITLVPNLRAGETTARERQPRRLPTHAEINDTISLIRNESIRDILWLMHFTKLRMSEVVRLRSKDINRDGQPWLYLRKEKRGFGSDKMIELGPEAQAIILRHEGKKRRSPGPIFRDNTGKQWNCFTVRDNQRKACRKAGVPKWSAGDITRIERMQPPSE